MKFLNKLLALLLATASIFAFTACGETEEEKLDTSKTGWAFECEVEKNDDDVEYGVIKGLLLADKIKYDLGNKDYDKIAKDYPELVNLVIGDTKSVKVAKYNKGEAQYKDNKLETETLNDLAYIEIDDAAFANQLVIKNVKIGENVTKVGSGAFAGCSRIEKMEVPFTGVSKDSVNEKKLFASVFGTTESADCTSVETTYNMGSESKATFFVPNALKEVVVNYKKDAVSAPAEGETPKDPEVLTVKQFAFSKLVNLEKVTITGDVEEIERNAFEGCTALKEVVLPNTVKTVGQFAFKGCASLVKVNAKVENDVLVSAVNFPTALETIFQEAFMGCAKLGTGVNKVEGVGDFVLSINAKNIHERAFKDCTSLKAVNFTGTDVTVNDYAFYGCTSLEKVNGTFTENGKNIFVNCPKLDA